MRKIGVFTGTRADYGLYRSLLNAITNHQDLSLEVIVTGMHLMNEFKHTVDEIIKDGYPIKIINNTFDNTKLSMTNFLGRTVTDVAKYILENRPDILVVLGDRVEMIGATLAAAYTNTPVAQLRAGEFTSTIDEPTRHAISQYAHILFTVNQNAKDVLIKMGEDPNRIFVVGDSGLDPILAGDFTPGEEVARMLNLDRTKPIVVVAQHSVTTEADQAGHQVKETLEAVTQFGYQTVVVTPNADPGNRLIFEAYEGFKQPFFRYLELGHRNYLGLLSITDVLVGNSSSGISEAPAFKLPYVNIGKRQRGREQGINVINVNHNKDEIYRAIERALSPEFKESLKDCKSPYAGDGNSGVRIAEILSTINLDREFLQKSKTYAK